MVHIRVSITIHGDIVDGSFVADCVCTIFGADSVPC